MSSHLERVSLKNDPEVPVVVIREHLLRYVLALDLVAGKDVLDVACGTGYGMHLMSYLAKTVSGYDISLDALEEATKFKYECPICLEQRDLEEPLLLGNDKTDKFDVITCFETVEHLVNPRPLFNKIRESLRPDGVLLFSIPNCRDLVDINEWHKAAYNLETITSIIKEHFPKSEVTFWGQDQWGFSSDLKKPYLVGKVQL